MQGFWDTMASREFLEYMRQIAESLEVIADYIIREQDKEKTEKEEYIK